MSKQKQYMSNHHPTDVKSVVNLLASSFDSLLSILYKQDNMSLATLKTRTSFLTCLLGGISEYSDEHLDEMGVFDSLVSIFCSYIGIEKTSTGIAQGQFPSKDDFFSLENETKIKDTLNKMQAKAENLENKLDYPDMHLNLERLMRIGRNSTHELDPQYSLIKPRVHRKMEEKIDLFMEAAMTKKRIGQHAVIITSPPGSGKSTLLRNIRSIYKDHAECIDLNQDLISSSYSGRSSRNVKYIFDQLVEVRKPVFVFIDEADSFLASRKSSDNSAASIAGKSTVSAVLLGIDNIINHNAPVFLIMATNYLDNIEPALLDRCTIYEMPNISRDEVDIVVDNRVTRFLAESTKENSESHQSLKEKILNRLKNIVDPGKISSFRELDRAISAIMREININTCA